MIRTLAWNSIRRPQRPERKSAKYGGFSNLLVCQFCSLMFRCLHSTPAKVGVKPITHALLWVWGRSMLKIFELSRSSWQRRWAARFASCGLSSTSYRWDSLKEACGIYVKVALGYKKAYVGMFASSMVNREASRIRKFRQVGLVHVEPALKWWKRQNCFFKFVPIVVKVFPTKVEAEVSETMLQRVAKPE